MYHPIFQMQKQEMFNESVKNSFSLVFDSWSLDRKIANAGKEYQVDLGSAQSIDNAK